MKISYFHLFKLYLPDRSFYFQYRRSLNDVVSKYKTLVIIPKREMNATIFRKRQIHEITKIINEYSQLICLTRPSDEQLDRIEEILEQAISNHQLAEYLNKIDEEIAQNINYLNNDNLLIEEHQFNPKSPKILISEDADNQNATASPQPNICLNQEGYSYMEDERGRKYSPSKTDDSNLIKFPNPKVLQSSANQSVANKNSSIFSLKWSKNNLKLASCLGVGVLLLYLPLLHTLFQFKGAFGYFTNNPHAIASEKKNNPKKELAITKVSICGINPTTASTEIQEYYNSYLELKKQIPNQQLQYLEIKMQVKRLQSEAEMQQRKWEINQQHAESEKLKAERQKNFALAQKRQEQADNALANSREWLCLSQQVLALHPKKGK